MEWIASRWLSYPARALAAGTLGTLVVIAACGRPHVAPEELEGAERPPDLAQLDKAVREQFEVLWKALHELDGTSSGSEELGAAWGGLGQWYDIYGYSDSAGRCYRNACRLDPDEPRWNFYLGALAEEAGDLDAAEQYFTTAAELAPEAEEPRVRLGDLALDRQDFDSAGAIYSAILATNPESPGALVGSGRLALLNGDAEGAIKHLETLIRMQPEAGQVHYLLSLAWRQVGDEERAAEQLRLVPEDNLDQIPVILNAPWEMALHRLNLGSRDFTRRGVRAYRRGEHFRAAAYLGRAVSSDPEGPEERINYSLALRGTGNWPAAVEQLQEALRLAPEGSELSAKAHLELGRLLAVRGRPAEGARHLEAALAIDPQSQAAHVELGRLLHNQGKLEEALEHYAAVRGIDRALPGTRFWHAAVLMQLGRWQDALASLEEDLQQIGGDRQLALLLARLLSAAPEAALRDVTRARTLLAGAGGPADVLYAETAAMVAAEEGNFADAVAWEQAAVDAVARLRPRTAVHTARRRLVLYQEGRRCRNPWEEQERPVLVAVTRP